ncbi:MAG: VCBS repeat-containing protein [Alphaproteobacteria bacterium]|nr:VCBS repeat-containing protein [Alphaproteobacteria bacterium]
MRLLPLTLLLSACFVTKSEHQALLSEECLDGLAEQAYVDLDGDGLGALVTADDCDGSIEELEELFQSQVEEGGDCDDADPEVGDERVYADVDGDGYGAGLLGAGCEAGPGESLVSGDCDDGDAEVSPEGQESCDGEDDEDCDGSVDEGFEVSLWYADGDGDGYGSGAGLERCEGLTGEVSEGGDCDDSDASAYPGAPEVVGDGVDGDCDGEADELPEASWSCDGGCAVSWAVGGGAVVVGDGGAGEAWLLSVGAGGFTESGSASGSGGFGEAVQGLGSDAWAAGAPSSGDGVVRWYAGSTERGRVEGGGSYSEVGASLGGGPGVLLVQALVPDFELGTVLVFAPPSGAVDASDYDARITGFTQPEQPFTLTLAPLDGDGAEDDVVVGAPDEISGSGAVYLFSDLTQGGSVNVSAGTRLSGSSNESLGQAVVVADFDGDGAMELALGGSDGVYLLDAVPGEGDRVSDLATATIGRTPSEVTLTSTDLDGDGIPELVLGGGSDRLWFFAEWPTGGVSLDDGSAQALPSSEGEAVGQALAGEPGGSGLVFTTESGVGLAWGVE